jgi:hypothetical protein
MYYMCEVECNTEQHIFLVFMMRALLNYVLGHWKKQITCELLFEFLGCCTGSIMLRATTRTFLVSNK